MKQVIIENPVTNSSFEEPARYFRIPEDDITNEIVSGPLQFLLHSHRQPPQEDDGADSPAIPSGPKLTIVS